MRINHKWFERGVIMSICIACQKNSFLHLPLLICVFVKIVID